MHRVSEQRVVPQARSFFSLPVSGSLIYPSNQSSAGQNTQQTVSHTEEARRAANATRCTA